MLLMMSSIVSADNYQDYEIDEKGCYCPPPPLRPEIDVVFVIDSTGSMTDEIRAVKTHITNIVREVESGQPSPELRVGIVTYRDHKLEENEYVYKTSKLTNNLDSSLRFLEHIEARGGGDTPEAVADGLDQAVSHMNWMDNSKKLIFLIGDAAPHGEGSTDQNYQQGCPEGHDYKDSIEEAQEKDIKIFAISGSGMDSTGTNIWREIARKTGGEYEKLNYVRQNLDVYYEEEGIDEKYADEARADSDYDSSSNTILTNTFGKFAKKALMTEAADMGVRYDDTESEVIHYDNLVTGDAITEVEDSQLGSFFKKVFDKLVFW